MPDKQPPGPEVDGEPLDWDEAEIAKLAEVTEADKADAAADWRKKTPKAAKRLLDAREADDVE